MDGSSIVDTIKIGLEYILLAIFLMLAVRVIQIRNDCSNAMNVKTVMENTTKENLEFSQYQMGNDQNNKNRRLQRTKLFRVLEIIETGISRYT